jgi:AcrR family transcriptional regulator
MAKTTDKATPRPAEQLRADARQNHARLLAAATEAFAEHGADAPLEDIARRAGVGIGTLYRHFPTRLDLQAAAFRNQVSVLCGQAEDLMDEGPPGQAFLTWIKALAAYMTTKRGLSKALMEALGKDSEVISACWVAMRDTTERTLSEAQEAGLIRTDVASIDVMRLVHGVVSGTEHAPDQTPRLLSIMLDGLRPQAAASRPEAQGSPTAG